MKTRKTPKPRQRTALAIERADLKRLAKRDRQLRRRGKHALQLALLAVV